MKKNIFQLQMFGRYGKNAYLCNTRTPKPLYNAKIGGRFFIYTMTVNFDKSYTSPESIIGILYERGLNIDDQFLAVDILRNVGYYRFSAYLYPFLTFPKERHLFKQGSRFSRAWELYRFDKKLRMLLFNEIEKIEVALRSTVANMVAEETGNIFWMTDGSLFANEDKFRKTMALVDKELKSSKEDFIKHFKNKYSNDYPPAWMLVEILPLGIVTRIYDNLADNALRKKIAARFLLPVPVFSSWITIITLVRNTCCHHSRVWNKENAITPMLLKKTPYRWISKQISPNRTFYDVCILKWFIDIISPENDMKSHLKNLLSDFPHVDIAAMGFPKNWEEEPLWK